jgi:serine/threonine-protein phosphatase 5
LRNSGKGGADPCGQFATNIVATDVLWSDPVSEPGLACNDARGVGMLFGPDITQQFLEAHNLQLIVRSHEGPDARCGREDMQSMQEGFTLDHNTPAGMQPRTRCQLLAILSAFVSKRF